jgi:hypothetical protein
MMSWRPPWRERQERLDAEIDENRATMLAELTRVRKLMRSGVHIARIALFSVPGEKDHHVAILRRVRPVPRNSTLIVHNYPVPDEPVPMIGTTAWMVGPKFIQFSDDASYQRRGTDEWIDPVWAPRIDIHGGTHLSISATSDMFWAQDGVPIQDTSRYPENTHGPRHRNTEDQARALAAGVHALQLCTAESIDRNVTQFVPHIMGESSQ